MEIRTAVLMTTQMKMDVVGVCVFWYFFGDGMFLVVSFFANIFFYLCACLSVCLFICLMRSCLFLHSFLFYFFTTSKSSQSLTTHQLSSSSSFFLLSTHHSSIPPLPPSDISLTPLGCRKDEFSCLSEKQCIPLGFHCDNQTDCVDGSDEYGCSEWGKGFQVGDGAV